MWAAHQGGALKGSVSIFLRLPLLPEKLSTRTHDGPGFPLATWIGTQGLN